MYVIIITVFSYNLSWTNYIGVTCHLAGNQIRTPIEVAATTTSLWRCYTHKSLQ
jgi:hypothetical protein